MKEDTFLDALSERIKKENVLREGQPEVCECTHSRLIFVRQSCGHYTTKKEKQKNETGRSLFS